MSEMLLARIGQLKSGAHESIEDGASVIPERILRSMAAKLRTSVIRGPGGCMLWTGYRQPNGYGYVNVSRYHLAAHRLALMLSGVAVPSGMDVCHTCDVRNCINPAHLYVGTRRQNMADCTARRRHNKPHGAHHWSSKLSDNDVRAIRAASARGELQADIAARFSINAATVSRIARKIWRGEVA